MQSAIVSQFRKDSRGVTTPSSQHGLRIGLDLGGSKIEGIAMDSSATELARYRIATPRDDYAGTIAAIVDLAAS